MEEKKENGGFPPSFDFKPVVLPAFGLVQRMIVYETKMRYYLVGSNLNQRRFRVLKIDRTEPHDLVIVDDKVEYTKDEIRELLKRIDVGNRPRFGGSGSLHSGSAGRNSLGLSKTISAFGIIGFVRFLEGYYILLITKRRKVALIGYHSLYKIADSKILAIPNESVRIQHPDEQKYLRLFLSIDLSSNFYFSYSYDLTHPLQYNMAPPRILKPVEFLGRKDKEFLNNTWNKYGDIKSEFSPPPSEYSWLEDQIPQGPLGKTYLAVRPEPNWRFVWNRFLMLEASEVLHHDWVLHITHGFIDQINVSIFGRPYLVTLIARRSNRFAGTRFLKRGANYSGDVANEVETEQIVHDSQLTALQLASISSFVQIRGSVPCHWSQDISKMVPKPPIVLDLPDPYYRTAAAHYNQLLSRYGSPVVVMNLVKQRERKKQECYLTGELVSSLETLNVFLPPKHRISYVHFDMARCNKRKEAQVMSKLQKRSLTAIRRTGFFLSQPMERNYKKALNAIPSADLEFDSDCLRMLEMLYEDHGDFLALQYGGSNLVHRIKTYRKTAHWTAQTSDIMQTLSRYYSNAFSDSEKQNAINLFLGVFEPSKMKHAIWDIPSDFYLHNEFKEDPSRRSCSAWYERSTLTSLPRPSDECSKTVAIIDVVSPGDSPLDDVVNRDRVDGFSDFYAPRELSVMAELFAYQMSHSVRDFMPNHTVDFSPFNIRVLPGKRVEAYLGSKGGRAKKRTEDVKNPSLTGRSTALSTGHAGYVDFSNFSIRNVSKGRFDQTSVKENLETLFQDELTRSGSVYSVPLPLIDEDDAIVYSHSSKIMQGASLASILELTAVDPADAAMYHACVKDFRSSRPGILSQ
ncbi:unnamed protein product [Cyprideis torosa]|uniref:Uncharacterized protein n=1 Tax=Cyprideis torosa TaxID=163714 RepID=A0A7R8W2E4_9CRUS|nr:unnamed protein product [Cyprideis torosa]CAG0881896.1 unnamed protein product [Cyprideis torosa]